MIEKYHRSMYNNSGLKKGYTSEEYKNKEAEFEKEEDKREEEYYKRTAEEQTRKAKAQYSIEDGRTTKRKDGKEIAININEYESGIVIEKYNSRISREDYLYLRPILTQYYERKGLETIEDDSSKNEMGTTWEYKKPYHGATREAIRIRISRGMCPTYSMGHISDSRGYSLDIKSFNKQDYIIEEQVNMIWDILTRRDEDEARKETGIS